MSYADVRGTHQAASLGLPTLGCVHGSRRQTSSSIRRLRQLQRVGWSAHLGREGRLALRGGRG